MRFMLASVMRDLDSDIGAAIHVGKPACRTMKQKSASDRLQTVQRPDRSNPSF